MFLTCGLQVALIPVLLPTHLMRYQLKKRLDVKFFQLFFSYMIENVGIATKKENNFFCQDFDFIDRKSFGSDFQ